MSVRLLFTHSWIQKMCVALNCEFAARSLCVTSVLRCSHWRLCQRANKRREYSMLCKPIGNYRYCLSTQMQSQSYVSLIRTFMQITCWNVLPLKMQIWLIWQLYNHRLFLLPRKKYVQLSFTCHQLIQTRKNKIKFQSHWAVVVSLYPT